MEEQQTCGKGLAEHSSVPAKFAEFIEALVDNLEAHLPTINVAGEEGRRERAAYESLAAGFRRAAEILGSVSAEMRGYRILPMAPHHEAAFADPRIAQAFARFVAVEGELGTMLGDAHARDLRMLEQMSGGAET